MTSILSSVTDLFSGMTNFGASNVGDDALSNGASFKSGSGSGLHESSVALKPPSLFEGVAGAGSTATLGGFSAGTHAAFGAELWAGAAEFGGAVLDVALPALGTAAGTGVGWLIPSGLGKNDADPGPNAQLCDEGQRGGESAPLRLTPGPKLDGIISNPTVMPMPPTRGKS
jgi:hypothetical protein